MVTKVRDDFYIFSNYHYFLSALQIVTGGLNELLNRVTSLKPLLHLKLSLVSLMTEV